jgi:ATP-dependent helicase/nuclease subunit B
VLDIQSTELDPGDVTEIWSEFGRLMASYSRPGQGYTARRALESVRDVSDYDHLSRFGEWDMTEDPSPEDLA